MIFAHAFVGMILAYLLEKFLIIKKNAYSFKTQKLIIWASFAIGAVFPDTDILYVLFINPNVFHRDLPSHWLLPYLFIYLIIYLVIRLKNFNKFYLNVVKAFTIGVISHLLADLYVDDVYLLMPISKEGFLWQPFELDKNAGFAGYFRSFYMFSEILIILTGQALMLTSFAKFNKEFKIMICLSIGILIAATIFLWPFVNTFN